jgi:hypothetical protein
VLSVSLPYVPGELLVGFDGGVAETYTVQDPDLSLQLARGIVGSHAEDWNDGNFSVTQVDLAGFPLDLAGYQAIYVDSNAGAPVDHAAAISDFVTAGGGLVTENGGCVSQLAERQWAGT